MAIITVTLTTLQLIFSKGFIFARVNSMTRNAGYDVGIHSG